MQPRTLSLLLAMTLGVAGQAASTLSTLSQSQAQALAKIHPGLLGTGETVTAVVRLTDPPLLSRLGRNAKINGLPMSRSEQAAYVAGLKEKQAEIIRRTVAAGGSTEGRLTKALNAVIVRVASDRLPEIAELATVAAIRPIGNYELDLSETVPYIGAATAQAAGVTGAGIRVAVLDSGVDYTHKNLGGPGTLAAFEAAYGTDPADAANKSRGGLFPTSKVVGGWDFVGEDWPNSPESPDEDPIDFQGHGTHVADIIAGASIDGTHKGVAPGASLYAFKVCSAVATTCSGLGILLGLEACLNPDNPVDVEFIENPVDIINLSLGSSYGQIQDDSAYMVELISQFGITVVVSAGNSGDLPYIVGSPSIAPGALSVAQTQVPSAKAFSVRIFKNSNRPTSEILNTADIAWAPVDKTVNGPLIYVGRGCVGDPYLVPESKVKNAIVIVDRGVCAVSGKVDRAARLGAKGVIIVNNVPGDPPTFSQGEGSLFVPTLVVSQADGEALKASLAGNKVRATFGPRLFQSLGGSMASTSSRGPSYSFQTIKPEIGAPGASVSAEVGTGTGQTVFGGTSGAAPMVAGAAALLQSRYLSDFGFLLSSYDVKAFLMNHAEPNILISPVSKPGVLAPITRIGAGEVRVDRALAGTAAAVTLGEPIEGDPDLQSSISFGYRAWTLAGATSITRTIYVLNYSPGPREFTLASSFRYADDSALGAVSLAFSAPTVTVAPWGVGAVNVTLSVDPAKLAPWQLNGGTQGGNGDLLTLQEIDGFITLNDGTETLRMPWHLLPRKAADQKVSASSVTLAGGVGTLGLSNTSGAVTGASDIFLLGGTSPLDYPKPDWFGANQALPDLRAAGVRLVGSNLEFAIATHEERSHPGYPAEFDVYFDVNNDGVEDYVLYNATTSGNVRVSVLRLADNVVLGSVPADVDFNSSTVIYRIPAAAVGITSASVINWYVLAFDNYFTGAFTDLIFDPTFLFLTHTLNQPRYAVAGTQSPSLASGGSTTLNISAPAGGGVASPSQEGFLILHRNAQPNRWADVIEVTAP